MFEVSFSSAGFVNRFIHRDIRDVRLFTLAFAVLLYGAFGSPTPDSPGLFEVFIGGCLIVAVGFGSFTKVFNFSPELPLWIIAGRFFLVFGLVVPVVSGVIAGNDTYSIIRDVVPFLFMMLPVLLWDAVRVYSKSLSFVFYSVLAAGLLFAVRSVVDVAVLGGGDALYYLSNAPTVLFTSIFFAGTGMIALIERFSLRSCVTSIVLCGLAAMCLWPIIETQQRASLGAFVFSMTVLSLVQLCKKPRRMIVLLVGVGCALIPFSEQVFEVLANFGRKTELVGANMRVQEWSAVWAEISGNPLSLIFGQGWGATFASPAVADIEVNFTHGLLSSLLLKAGISGFVLGAAYVVTFLRLLLPVWNKWPVVVLAILCPVLIDVLLYASFKSLDFGLVLLLIPIFYYQSVFFGEDRDAEIASGRGVLYSETVAK